MADDHRTVLLSILATVLAGVGLFIITTVINGGVSWELVRGYVLPLFISAFTLSIFWGVVFARNKGKLPWLFPDEVRKVEQQPQPDSSSTQKSQ